MPSAILTELEVKALKPKGSTRYEVFDERVPGFAVRVSPSGQKSFVLLYRQKGRQRRLTLGRYPIVSLAEARRLALDALNGVVHGADPQQDKLDRRKHYRFDEAAASFLEMHCARRNRPSTASQAAATIRQHFSPKWANRDVREIKRADVFAILDQLTRKERPAAAIRALAVIRKFFNWCVERGVLEQNPCAGIKPPATSNSRTRVLDERELAAVWGAASETEYPFGPIVRLLILTAQRRHEVTEMRWSEINFDKALWSIPPTRTKNGRAQIVPLTPAAINLLSSLPHIGDGYVFPALGRRETAFSGFSKSKGRLEDLSGVAGWSLHDLRRTAATGMASLGVAPHVIERILNHVSGSFGGVAGIYNRFGYLPEMRASLEQWSERVRKIADASEPKVRSA